MEGLNKENKIEIRPTGSYLETDKEGYLINPASSEKLQEKWKPVIDEVVEISREHWGDKLSHIYIRGSVAKGEAVDGVSDIDFLIYVDLSEDEIKNGWTDAVETTLIEKYPFVTGIEFGASPATEIPDDHMFLNQSLLVYGEPVELRKMKPGKDVMRHLPGLGSRMAWLDKKIPSIDTSEETEKACSWFMKGILRAGFEMTMERSGRYTRDLYLCYKDFSEYYPDKEPLMREVLDLALNPTTDKQKILQIKDQIVPWMMEEGKKYI